MAGQPETDGTPHGPGRPAQRPADAGTPATSPSASLLANLALEAEYSERILASGGLAHLLRTLPQHTPAI
jgi:hypothetical protein